MTPDRLLHVFRSLAAGIQVGVRTPEEWGRWYARGGYTAAEADEVMGLSLRDIERGLAPLRPPEE